LYLKLLSNKNIAVVANHSSLINNRHLVDSLIALGIKVSLIFSPEHGFRGMADAGEDVKSSVDPVTKIPVISLYGDKQKPRKEDMAGINAVVFDIQDVGARFYTYISTMRYVMETCAAEGIPFIVLDRPNPNGYYVDGPTLKPVYKSFIGMHCVPLVHGMTVGEYARMINDEGWLEGGKRCSLTVIQCTGYTHKMHYDLPVKPSPNLPNARSVELYPTLGLFEGTAMSCARGTDFPFQAIGHPGFKNKSFSFVPRSIPGACKTPPFQGVECYGLDLREEKPLVNVETGKLNVGIIIYAYRNTVLKEKQSFFRPFFTRLCGTEQLAQQIINDVPEQEIRESWKADIDKFKKIRKKYLLYPDFE